KGFVMLKFRRLQRPWTAESFLGFDDLLQWYARTRPRLPSAVTLTGTEITPGISPDGLRLQFLQHLYHSGTLSGRTVQQKGILMNKRVWLSTMTAFFLFFLSATYAQAQELRRNVIIQTKKPY